MAESPIVDETTVVLVTEPEQPQHYTVNRETDARTAMTLGLAEYISTLEITGAGGRLFSFNRVYAAWAEPEDEAFYPMACVHTDSPGEYEASKLVPALQRVVSINTNEPKAAIYLIQPTEMSLDMMIDVWTTDPQMRQNIVAMLEEAMNPVEWRYGVLLELPFYFNERASYEMTSLEYNDSQDEAQQRMRKARMHVRGRVPVTRLTKAPPADVRERMGPDLEFGEVKKPGVIRGRG